MQHGRTNSTSWASDPPPLYSHQGMNPSPRLSPPWQAQGRLIGCRAAPVWLQPPGKFCSKGLQSCDLRCKIKKKKASDSARSFAWAVVPVGWRDRHLKAVPLIIHSAHNTFSTTQTNKTENQEHDNSGHPDQHAQLCHGPHAVQRFP